MASIHDLAPGHPLHPVKEALMRAFNLTDTRHDGTPAGIAYKLLPTGESGIAWTDRDKRALEYYAEGAYSALSLLTGDGYCLLAVTHSLSGLQAWSYETDALTLPVKEEILDADQACGGVISGAMMRHCELLRLKWIRTDQRQARDTRAMAVYLIEGLMLKVRAPRPS
jgi:hypothetical protein